MAGKDRGGFKWVRDEGRRQIGKEVWGNESIKNKATENRNRKRERESETPKWMKWKWRWK